MHDAELLAYSDADVALGGTIFHPPQAPRAAVLVFPTIMNPTPSVIEKARSLAAHGYLAMIADFYGQQPDTMDAAREQALAIRQTPAQYRARLRAALKALATHDAADGLPVAAIGFCMGGQAALELARDGAPLFAAASFHGMLDTQAPATRGRIQARILVCHGDADPMVPREQVLKFWQEMDEAHADWHFHAYSGVKHGFTNQSPSQNPATAYDASADRQSWAAMHSLFDEILGQS